MKRYFRWLCFCIAALALPGPSPARANQGQAFDNAWNICAEQTALIERRTGVPKHLLRAISLAESGRWDTSKRANVAWPWTVTSGGKGRYFDTKAEALAEVEILMTQGVRNIDVGCMQINLFYHGGAFETLEESFDPQANTTYAAAYLKNMFAATGNWMEAAGYYHSTTPERNEPYKRKVLAFWRGQGGGPGDGQGDGFAGLAPDSEPKPYAPIDYIRMAKLNASFRARKEAARGDGVEAGPRNGIEALKATAARELDAWRDARSRGLGMTNLIAMRQAELKLKEKREWDRLGRDNKEDAFSAKRAMQLRDWRLKVSNQGKRATALPLRRTKLSATGMAASAAAASVR